MDMSAAGAALGLDFGTTNSVVAHARAGGMPELIAFEAPEETSAVFRSALCFWHDDAVRGGLAVEAGPWAIAEYLGFPQDSRFIQSFKSVAAMANFEHASVFEKRFRFEELGRLFLDRLVTHAGGRLDERPRRIIVGRPVEYAGAKPDPALAHRRYQAMFAGFGAEIHYVYEPLGAAFSYAARLTEPATILVADFGGGTSDFSVVRVAEPGAARRCVPLGHAGIGIAGDRFDYRIVDRLVLPMLGKGGSYRSFDKILEIPRGYFSDFADWSRLALMRNRRTLEELNRLRRSALEPEAIGRMIAVIENELGYPLYDAVGRLKRALSVDDRAQFPLCRRRARDRGRGAPDRIRRLDCRGHRPHRVDGRSRLVGGGRLGRADRPGVPDRRLVAHPPRKGDLRGAFRGGEDHDGRRTDLDRAWPGADRSAR